nr:MAG TPA: hypothetical protein [Microviridae sp.]
MNEGVALGLDILKDAIGLGISKTTKEEQMRQQYELNEAGAQAAAKRNMELYKQQYEMNTPAAIRRNLEAAGLSVGLMYGGKAGSTQGISANAPAASVSQGNGIENPLSVSAMNLSQIKLNNAQEELLKKEKEKVEAEKNRIEADANKTNKEADIIDKTAKYIISEASSRATIRFFERIETTLKWENNFSNPNEMQIFKDDILGRTFYFWNGSIKGQEILLDIAKKTAEVAKEEGEADYYDAMKKLTDEKAKYYFAELCIEAYNAQTTRESVEAQARKIALETGDETNWLTWVNLALRTVEAGGDVAGAFTKIGKFKQIVKELNEKK